MGTWDFGTSNGSAELAEVLAFWALGGGQNMLSPPPGSRHKGGVGCARALTSCLDCETARREASHLRHVAVAPQVSRSRFVECLRKSLTCVIPKWVSVSMLAAKIMTNFKGTGHAGSSGIRKNYIHKSFQAAPLAGMLHGPVQNESASVGLEQ